MHVHAVAVFLLILTWSVSLTPAAAELGQGNTPASTLSTQLDRIEARLHKKTGSSDLEKWIRQLVAMRVDIANCVSINTDAISVVEQNLATLGEKLDKEPSAVRHKRIALSKEKNRLEKQLATCRLLNLRNEELHEKVQAIHNDILAKRFLARGPAFPRLVKDHLLDVYLWFDKTGVFIFEHSGLEKLGVWSGAGLLLTLFITLWAGSRLRRRGMILAGKRREAVTFSAQLKHALLTCFAHYTPHLLVSTSSAVYFYLSLRHIQPVPFISVVAYAIPVIFLLAALLRVFLNPVAPARVIFNIDPGLARSLSHRLRVLVLLIFIGYLLFATILAQSLPDAAILFSRGVFAGFLVLNLMWIVWLLGRLFRVARNIWLRSIVNLLLLAVVFAEWLGYRNLSESVLQAVLGSMITLGVLWLSLQFAKELFANLAEEGHGWNRAIRRLLGVKAQEQIPGLLGLEVLVYLSLFGLFSVVVLQIWGLSDPALQQLRAYIVDGFNVGSLKIIPFRLIMAILVFVVLLAASSWVKKQLEQRVLRRTRIERGAREAIITVSGYIGIAIALLVALGIAGLEFGNIAIIAGALSVGIGFGLQNIVNNFISGLILLFERPIKTGDWIVVGNTEGYVKRIRMRSTQIETFDRADVIVPNSELISNQVTNWVLSDERGRIVVQVGVAYGSDTGKVKQILLDIAEQNKDVISNMEAYRPQVLFRNFGDSALNFELRGYIRNINKRLSVISNLNFAIDAAFREESIEIPFPQRDVHIRDWRKSEKDDSRDE